VIGFNIKSLLVAICLAYERNFLLRVVSMVNSIYE
jgi:hypothetical protein